MGAEGGGCVINSSDEKIAELLNTDPQQGYIELVNVYLGFVYKITYSKLAKTCSKEDIEEFVSDIFYEFYCNRHKINLEKGSIKAILAVFTKRRAINLFHKKTKTSISHSVYEDNLRNILRDSKNVEQQILKKERQTELIAAIQLLGYPDSEILIRKHCIGQTLKEISMDLDMKTKTVEKRHERALKKLKKVFGGVGIGEK